jgi:hypothetical protein
VYVQRFKPRPGSSVNKRGTIRVVTSTGVRQSVVMLCLPSSPHEAPPDASNVVPFRAGLMLAAPIAITDLDLPSDRRNLDYNRILNDEVAEAHS